MSAESRLNDAKKKLNRLESKARELQEELDEVEDEAIKMEAEIEKITHFKYFTYGAGVSWDGKIGIVVGIQDDDILVICKDQGVYFEERVDMKLYGLAILEFDAGRILFDEIRAQGRL